MATKARQQYFADETSLQKQSREFSIADEIQQKIDSVEEGAQVNKIDTIKVNGSTLVPDIAKAVNVEVPEVIDNLYTVDSDNALSAKQGKLLYDYIQNIASRGRFLSNWNSATGLPMTNPSESPYPYKSGDYFVVSNVAGLGGANYRPDGSSYIIGQASTVVETESVDVSDFYFYDGTTWLLLKNSARSGAVDSSLSTTSTNPVENRVITNALNGKQEALIAGSNIQIAADGKTISATDTTYNAGTNISIDANNQISAVDTTYTAGANVQISAQNVISATDTTYTAGPGISISNNNVISNTQTSAEWGNITGTLSDQTDLQSALDAKQDILTAGDNITIGDVYLTESDMKGPAPSGFHVPLNTEWQAVCDVWTALGGGSSDGPNFGIALKLPFAGYRDRSYAGVSYRGSDGLYWSSSCFNNSNAYSLYFYSAALNPKSASNRAHGLSVRCFKNSPTVPTSSWIKLYGTSIEAGGIFWNSTDGLISLSSDGQTWITIADKNLGATTVWNSGDTLSEANCGKYYQRGNNYGFAWTGTVTTSSTQVDASTYGPGNYYSSSTFITRSSSPFRWDSTDNWNLWGGVTQGTWQDCIHNVISSTDTTYTVGPGIAISANNEISNTLPGPTIAATAPTGTEGALWYDTTNDVLMAHDGTDWKEAGTQMKVLSYGNSTWNDFITAYQKNGVVYCRASSNSNPATGTQGRLAFMAYVNNADNPTEVEFQYYRSRSDHNSAANQLDEVYVYKLTSNGTWSVTQRDTAAKSIAGTGIGLTYNASGMTISADTSVLATQTDLNSKQDTLVSGTNIKTVNGNSLLGSGNLTLNDVKVSATAPSSPTEGMVWYDTTNDQLKVYDGTNWNVTGKEYNAGPGISIEQIQDYSAMRGPCPEGYHIPLKDEWNDLLGILTNTFSLTGNEAMVGTYLKMPKAGFRDATTSSSLSLDYAGGYWSATSSGSFAYTFSFYPGTFVVGLGYQKYAHSIRPFKDSPVIPDSTWTTLYDGSSVAIGAGIFYNATLGLISISGDGTNWITITDKNLGATVVYNSGDTLSEANCGYLYQWGNNYGFSYNGDVATSSTSVDASDYGPGNYYSSSTFIKGSGAWSNPVNGNLRGGETGVVTLDNAITNTGVLSVNGQTGAVSLTIPTISTITVTLTSAGWSSNSQTVSATGVTASNTVIVSPAPSDIADYADCGVYCSAQGSGTLTFTCSTIPTASITVNVLIMNL